MSEIRRERSVFTKTLKKICSLLDSKPSTNVEWKHFISHEKITTEITAVSLWVAGSYARGAPNCGDLDLILEFSANSRPMPDGRLTAKFLFGSYPRVNVYQGTPTKNESGIEFNESVLIWHGKGFDWNKALESIPVNTREGRFERPTDKIPFRPEQLYADVDELEQLIELKEKGIIKWEFTSFNDLEPAKPEGTETEEAEFNDLVIRACGAKTQKLLPYLLSYFRKSESMLEMLLRSDFDKTRFTIRGSKVLIGHPTIPIHILNEITTSEIAIVPHITSRGPNGIWTISRGDKHPINVALEGLSAFFIFEIDEQLSIVTRLSKHDHFLSPSWLSSRALDIYTTKNKALSRARKVSKEWETTLTVKELKGYELLKALSYVDIIFLNDDDEYALTTQGQITLEIDELIPTKELLVKLGAKKDIVGNLKAIEYLWDFDTNL